MRLHAVSGAISREGWSARRLPCLPCARTPPTLSFSPTAVARPSAPEDVMKKLALSLILLAGPISLAAQEAPDPVLTAPRPIAARDEVWIDKMTFMEVRDAIAAGKTTVII